MGTYKEIEGDLIAEALKGSFDVIAHGCNCFCTMKRGIAPQMAEAFGCDKFRLETKYLEVFSEDRETTYNINSDYVGDINKLGQIEYKTIPLDVKLSPQKSFITVVNCYTQYHWSSIEDPIPFDYEAFKLCMRKINHLFKGKSIGLPMIGAGLGGANWNDVKSMIQKWLSDCDVTVVILPKIG